VIVASAITLLTASGLEIYAFLTRPAPRPFQNFVVTQVTNSGKVKSAAISPDGRFVAFVQNDKGMQSLWLRNLPTGSDTQIITPSLADYGKLLFSPDGNYIYFKMGKNPNWDGYNLFRCPLLGGSPQKIVRHVESFTFSPDGKRIAFARLNDPEPTKFQILSATAEGDNETVLYAASDEQPHGLAWRPKLDEIYYPTYSTDDGYLIVDFLDSAKHKSHRSAALSGKQADQIYWSSDGDRLFMLYNNRFRSQIGFLPSTGGDLERITRDSNDYSFVTLSSDGKTIATVSGRRPANVYILSKTGRGFNEGRPVLSPYSNDVTELGWSPNNSLLVANVSSLSNSSRLVDLEADSGRQTQLLNVPDPASIERFQSCGKDNLVLALGSYRTTMGVTIWRVGADGSKNKQLSLGKYDEYPTCSPDQKWVYYLDLVGQRILRVPLDGLGKAEALFDVPPNHDFAGGLTIFLDGKTLAAPVNDRPNGVGIAVYQVGSSSPLRIFDAGIYSGGLTDLQFTHDGNSVAYIKRRDGVDNLWVNRLDGSAPYPITDFKAEEIWGFSFSLDGKRLAVLRGHTESDVVLLQETTPHP